ncbi:hypothetical protein R0J90_23670, partial [Micrococcus sp. SIMBA_144]
GIVPYGPTTTQPAVAGPARGMAEPFSTGESLTKAPPPAVMAKDIPLKDIEDPPAPRYEEAAPSRQLIATDPVAKEVF